MESVKFVFLGHRGAVPHGSVKFIFCGHRQDVPHGGAAQGKCQVYSNAPRIPPGQARPTHVMINA